MVGIWGASAGCRAVGSENDRRRPVCAVLFSGPSSLPLLLLLLLLLLLSLEDGGFRGIRGFSDEGSLRIRTVDDRKRGLVCVVARFDCDDGRYRG